MNKRQIDPQFWLALASK